MHFIRDKKANDELEVKYVNTEEQLANLLTKPFTTVCASTLSSKFNVSIPPHLRLIRIVEENDPTIRKPLSKRLTYAFEWTDSTSNNAGPSKDPSNIFSNTSCKLP